MEETFSLNGYNDDSIATKDKKKNEVFTILIIIHIRN